MLNPFNALNSSIALSIAWPIPLLVPFIKSGLNSIPLVIGNSEVPSPIAAWRTLAYLK